MHLSRLALPGRLAAVASAWLVLCLCACDGDDPMQPRGGLSGAVRLTAQQTDLVGMPQAEIIELHADGILVTLRGDDGSERATPTVGGRFGFSDLPPGRYVASIGVDASIQVASAPVEIGQSHVELTEPLTLDSTARLRTFPNPFQQFPGLAIECTTAVAGPVEFEIFSPARMPVWEYSYTGPPGVQHVHWVGDDEQQQEVPDGLYWVVVRKGAVTEYSLVRKTSP